MLKWRLEQGLTQEELAELLVTSDATVSRIEHGDASLTLDWLEKLASLMGTTVPALYAPPARTAKAS